MSFIYAPFEPLPVSTSNNVLTESEIKNKKQILLKTLNALGAIEINSDGVANSTSTFYYSKKDDILYEVDNQAIQLLKPTVEVESHIRQLNKL